MKAYPHEAGRILCLAALVLAGCSPAAQVAASQLARNSQPDVSPEDLAQLVSDNTAFALDLLKEARPGEGNVVFSPYSVTQALAMVYAGARGETAAQMAEVLHFTLDPGRLHPALNALDLDLAGRPEEIEWVASKERFSLEIANALWGQKGWSFLPDYLDLLAENYGAGLRLVDFETGAERARGRINDWIARQTHHRINDILPAGSLDSSTRLVLANAIYFKATWQYPFDGDKTAPGLFTLLDGSPVQAEMMSFDSPASLSYGRGDGWQVVALPYAGGLTEMLILLPDAGRYDALLGELDPDLFTSILDSLATTSLGVTMPKFTFEADLGLRQALVELGMPDAFDIEAADFSGMDGARDLFITDAFHKAFVAVDESGTEASAATVVVMGLTAMPVVETVLTIDRPFLFFIRDVPTGSILFAGSLLDPR